jgi:hypothetical protein
LGDLKWALEKLLTDEKIPTEKRLRRAKGASKEFPVIGEPGADKILLFSGMAPIAAVPSARTGGETRREFLHLRGNRADFEMAHECPGTREYR